MLSIAVARKRENPITGRYPPIPLISGQKGENRKGKSAKAGRVVRIIQIREKYMFLYLFLDSFRNRNRNIRNIVELNIPGSTRK